MNNDPHVSKLARPFPSFAPQITKNGRWFVAVKTGVGPVSHIGDFAKEVEAMNWISKKSEYWPGGTDAESKAR